jgi:hypothetical protein
MLICGTVLDQPVRLRPGRHARPARATVRLWSFVLAEPPWFAINSRQLTVTFVDPIKVDVGDISLAKITGTVYLHLISALDAKGPITDQQ